MEKTDAPTISLPDIPTAEEIDILEAIAQIVGEDSGPAASPPQMPVPPTRQYPPIHHGGARLSKGRTM